MTSASRPAGPGTAQPERVIRLDRPGLVWLAGEPVPIELTGSGRPVARLSAETGRLRVGGEDPAGHLAAIDRWYRREARNRIEPLVALEGKRLGLEAKRVRIGDQRSRWGSCSTTGTLSFNWRLLIGEPEALRYVVIHELVHLEHHNHSRRFWAAVTEAMPDWKLWATWLKANQDPLLSWRPRT